MKAKMDVPKILKAVSFLICFSFLVVVHSQSPDTNSQSGFISLDCGRIPKDKTYSEPLTGITYISDEGFIDTGESFSISPEYKDDLQEQAAFVRAFPNGIRNCYKITVQKNTKYLIRATFVYGDYDGKKTPPEFELYYGVNFWDAVSLSGLATSTVKEIVHNPVTEIVQVCLVNVGFGTPFISALELRPLKNTTYSAPSGSLSLVFRADVGAAINESAYRYPYDASDRLWLPFTSTLWTRLQSSNDVYIGKTYEPPRIVMNTAATPKDPNSSMTFGWSLTNPNTVYFVYMYFAEFDKLSLNQSRGFNIILNNNELLYGPLYPLYLNQTTIYTPSGLTGGNITISIERLENSTLPPILNAVELYTLLDLSRSDTEQIDVDGIMKIKSGYGITSNWEADPCLPLDYLWKGINCSYDGLDPPRIISLNLSSSGLIGEISSYISNLTSLESLDLSNNNLTGSVPSFLSRLPKLKFLNLAGNKLKGSIPTTLIEKSESGLLDLRVGNNPNLNCSSLISCGNVTQDQTTKKSKNNVLVPILAGVGGSIAFLSIIAVIIFIVLKRRNVQPRDENDPLASKQRQFTYSEIVKITNSFQKTLGKGGFGTVYHGVIDKNTQVAVKVLTPPAQLAEQDTMQTFYHQQFQAEVTLLMRVHHANLTSLVGYCNEGDTKALIYEYMANGDLESHIIDSENANVLSWEQRLQIAIDSAQGLEYLHTGCKPQISHRDVKCTNILLNERFQAKIADFGLSKVFNDENASYVSTKVAGTRGYLDPEYYSTNRLNDKSDVYSFGVVLLEIITGRPAISRSQDRTHVIQWVTSMLSNGDIKSIVEPKLRGNFETNSVWKAVELAMACVNRAPSKRPTMSQVVSELKECLSVNLARRNDSRLTASPIDDSIELLSMTSGLSPSVR